MEAEGLAGADGPVAGDAAVSLLQPPGQHPQLFGEKRSILPMGLQGLGAHEESLVDGTLPGGGFLFGDLPQQFLGPAAGRQT